MGAGWVTIEPMALTIRPAGPDDFEAVGEITVRAYLDGGHLPADAEYAGTLADARSRAEGAELWVAVDDADGRVVGSVTFAAPGSEFHEIATADEGDVRMLAVDGTARGRGIGDALMLRCVERARDLGLVALALSTQPSMHAAHRIYERMGFERAPERDWSPAPGITLLAYRLDLSPSARPQRSIRPAGSGGR